MVVNHNEVSCNEVLNLEKDWKIILNHLTTYKIRDIVSYLYRCEKRVIDYLNTTKWGQNLQKIGKYSNNDSKFESKGSLKPRSEYEHLCDQYDGSHVTADTTRICLEDQTFSRFHQRDIPWVWSFFIVERRFRLKLEVQPDKRNDARYKVQVDFKLYGIYGVGCSKTRLIALVFLQDERVIVTSGVHCYETSQTHFRMST